MNGFFDWLRQTSNEQKLDAELRFHLEQQIKDNIKAGMPPARARREAAIAFGGLDQIKEACRDERPNAWLVQFAQDLCFGLRMLRKNPGFTTVAVLTLGLGIGANTAIFSFVNGVMLKPLPYANSDRIVRLWETLPEGKGYDQVSPLNYLDWEKENTVFDCMACTARGGRTILAGIGPPLVVLVSNVSARYFDIFSVGAALGRNFAPSDEEPGNDQVVIIPHALWQSQFGADPQVIGRSISLDLLLEHLSRPHTVIGVLPPGEWDRERLPNNSPDFHVFRPLAFTPAEKTRDAHRLEVYARLKPGIALDQAQAQMDTISARLAHAYPDSNKGRGAKVEFFAKTVVPSELRQSLYLLLAAVGMVLLIACANIANLTLARGATREQEVAIRASLGAGRWRLVRQLLTESLLLSAGGCIVGLGVAWLSLRGMEIMIYPGMLPLVATTTMDGHVLLFTLTLSILTAVICGLVPALQATRPELMGCMKQAGPGLSSGRGRQRMRRILLSIEVMLAFVLLTSAGLLLRSFYYLQKVDMGVADPAHVITAFLPIPDRRFATTAQFLAYSHKLEDRLRALPGVSDVALRGSASKSFQIADHSPVDRAHRPSCEFNIVTPSHARTLGERLIRGRLLNDRDAQGARPVIVINYNMAQKYFANEDPIGKRILLTDEPSGEGPQDRETAWEVVGVIASTKHGSPRSTDDHLGVYVTMEQSPSPPTVTLILYVRSIISPALLQSAIRNAVYGENPEQVVMNITTFDQIGKSFTLGDRFHLVILSVFGGLAVVLAAIGIYGVVSYSVTQRTHEFGIRAALGADSSDILGIVLRSTMAPVVIGLVVGLCGVFASTRFLSSLLYGVGEHDPLTVAAVVATLAAVAFVACYIPALRAAKVDPSVALRSE